MYSAIDDGSGIDSPSSRIPSMCIRIASRIRSSTSDFVSPVATQPGKSGENADKLLGVFSITIKYFGVIALILQSSLPQYAIECAGRNIVLRMPRNGHPSRLSRMFVLTMAALLSNQNPPIVLNYTQNFPNSHVSTFLWGSDVIEADERVR